MRATQFCILTKQNLGRRFSASKMHLSPTVVLLLLIYCLMCFPLFVGVLCLSWFCYALLCFHFSFAIILKRKGKQVTWLLLYYRCIVTILPHGALGWSALCDSGIS